MTEPDMYMKLYIVESRENHEILVRNLLALEKEEHSEAIDEIFRAAHTLKGMSASMGFLSMERLCHGMEDVFSLIRGGALALNRQLIDHLLACTDRIERLLDEIEQGGEESVAEIDGLLQRLQSWNGGGGTSVSPPIASNAEEPAETPEDGSIRYQISVTLNPTCTEKDIRALLVLQNLQELGSILSAAPPTDQIENGAFPGTFTLILASTAGEEAIRMAASGSEIADVAIEVFRGSFLPSVPGSNHANEPVKLERGKEVKNIRVDITRLDRMMNLVEDLVINRGRLKQIATRCELKELDDAINMMSRSVADLQNLMMNVRMIPLHHIFNRFPRVVRDVAHHDGKEVEFLMEGGETELDRSIMDGLSDPLLHLIRNAVNHGIERPEQRMAAGKNRTGRVRLSAHRDRDNVIIEIEDDGNGIQEEKVRRKALEMGIISPEEASQLSQDEVIQLLFRPGFSTADLVTDISGRGVGLDVVKSAIESLKGSIRVESSAGNGTRFQLILPPTMAIVEVMMVQIDHQRCAIPITNVVEVAVLRPDLIHHIGGKEVLLLREEVLPLRRLEEMFGSGNGREIVIIVQHQKTKAGIAIDTVEGQQEVVIKPLNALFGSCRGISGVTIPGDGEVIPVLDIDTLL